MDGRHIKLVATRRGLGENELALKAAEDGDGALVVRAYETAGRPARATIELPLVGRTIEADFGPAEVKTFRVPRDPDIPIEETNLLEW